MECNRPPSEFERKSLVQARKLIWRKELAVSAARRALVMGLENYWRERLGREARDPTASNIIKHGVIMPYRKVEGPAVMKFPSKPLLRSIPNKRRAAQLNKMHTPIGIMIEFFKVPSMTREQISYCPYCLHDESFCRRNLIPRWSDFLTEDSSRRICKRPEVQSFNTFDGEVDAEKLKDNDAHANIMGKLLAWAKKIAEVKARYKAHTNAVFKRNGSVLIMQDIALCSEKVNDLAISDNETKSTPITLAMKDTVTNKHRKSAMSPMKKIRFDPTISIREIPLICQYCLRDDLYCRSHPTTTFNVTFSSTNHPDRVYSECSRPSTEFNQTSYEEMRLDFIQKRIATTKAHHNTMAELTRFLAQASSKFGSMACLVPSMRTAGVGSLVAAVVSSESTLENVESDNASNNVPNSPVAQPPACEKVEAKFDLRPTLKNKLRASLLKIFSKLKERGSCTKTQPTTSKACGEDLCRSTPSVGTLQQEVNQESAGAQTKDRFVSRKNKLITFLGRICNRKGGQVQRVERMH
ncbi:hypothetical protein HDU67_007061 [Dinochytrium kinnereticum]|nr:hypothetical protein HDU67_007061 [Dinochytrium kinnereticum]